MNDTLTSIHTLNARENIFLEVMKNYFSLDSKQLNIEINSVFENFIEILNEKKINYKELRGALSPQTDRKEIALVFDTQKIKSCWYGFEVFKKILPLFNKKSSHSVLCGDYIGSNEMRQQLYKEFFNELNPISDVEYKHHSQFYIVYINNLSEKMFTDFNDGLKLFVPYVGYFNVTNSSFIKMYLSTILTHLFVKNKNMIIAGHEDDRSNLENVNVSDYSFEENGYLCKSLQSMYYSLFLSYKIERQVFDGFESDTDFSLNALSENVLNISDFNLLIEENKFKNYLLTTKLANLQRAGLHEMTIEELEKLIKNKIQDNYIYNLSFLPEYNIVKFNIILEITQSDSRKKIKILVALEYVPTDKTLKVITMV